jgi:hypothetical protein
MAAGLSVDLDRWRLEFDELMLRVGVRFAWIEPRRRMAAFVRGLLAGLPRVNWTACDLFRQTTRPADPRTGSISTPGILDLSRSCVAHHIVEIRSQSG